jgi:hypothetical protein
MRNGLGESLKVPGSSHRSGFALKIFSKERSQAGDSKRYREVEHTLRHC